MSITDVPVIVPSYRRAGRVTTDKLMREMGFKSVVVFVRSEEASEYRKHHETVRTVSSRVRGLGDTRQQMLDEYKGHTVIMMDDDIRKFSVKPRCTDFGKLKTATAADLKMMIDTILHMGQVGAIVDRWTVARPYREAFKYRGLMRQCFILRHDRGPMRFDRMQLFHDLDFSLQSLEMGQKMTIPATMCVESPPSTSKVEDGGADAIRAEMKAKLRGEVTLGRVLAEQLKELHPRYVQLDPDRTLKRSFMTVRWDKARKENAL